MREKLKDSIVQVRSKVWLQALGRPVLSSAFGTI